MFNPNRVLLEMARLKVFNEEDLIQASGKNHIAVRTSLGLFSPHHLVTRMVNNVAQYTLLPEGRQAIMDSFRNFAVSMDHAPIPVNKAVDRDGRPLPLAVAIETMSVLRGGTVSAPSRSIRLKHVLRDLDRADNLLLQLDSSSDLKEEAAALRAEARAMLAST